MFLSSLKSFLFVLNKDALVFLGMRLASIVLGIVSIILLCRAVTIQHYFLTDGLGLAYDMVPLGPLAYSLVWSVVSLVLPGCKRKYHPALDMGLDFFGWTLTFAAGGALFAWSLKDSYEIEICRAGLEGECVSIGPTLSLTEKSSAILLLLTGATHLVMFVRACLAVHVRRKQYVPSRNSFMQFKKDTDGSRIKMPLELNATSFVAADAKVLNDNASEHTTRPTNSNDCPV